MKHTTDELLVAAAVLQRAITMRTTAQKDMSAEQRTADMAEPGSQYLQQAWEELEGVARFIKAAPSA